MTSPTFVLVLTCLVLGEIAQRVDLKSPSSVHHERRQTGETLTLTCVHGDSRWIYWFKQTLGEELKIISGRNNNKYKSFYGEFKNDPRFTLDAQKSKSLLTISDLQPSDSATYHCIGCEGVIVEILATVTLSVEGSGLTVPALVHQSESEAVQHGGSVTLSCTVHTGGCDGGHSVYWFKDSEESHPGLIYTHGGRNHQCERRHTTETNTCVYNLPLRSLNVSHAGTYYCAVVSCGHILFGNGTRLDVGDELSSRTLLYSLSGFLIFETILIVFMAFSLYKMYKRILLLSQEARAAPSTNLEGDRDAEDVCYAALDVKMKNTSRRQKKTTNDDCVYSSVKM